MKSKINEYVNQDELVLWKGRPDIKCCILESIFNPFLIFAAIWFFMDIFVISDYFSDLEFDGTAMIFIFFMLCHLMPVWIYLIGVIVNSLKSRNIEYVLTDKAIYISNGLIEYNVRRKRYEDIVDLDMHKGFFDKIFGLGDVMMLNGMAETVSENSGKITAFAILNIKDYERIYNLIKNQQDQTKIN